MINSITNSDGVPTVYLPLFFILFVAGLKDIMEDSKKHSSDKQENHGIVHKAIKLINTGDRVSSRLSLGGIGKFADTFSENLRVGNIIKIR